MSGQLLLNGWINWADIFWVYFLGYLVVHHLLSFCVNAPKRPHWLNSNFVDATPPKLLNGLSWNIVGMFLNTPSCALFVCHHWKTHTHKYLASLTSILLVLFTYFSHDLPLWNKLHDICSTSKVLNIPFKGLLICLEIQDNKSHQLKKIFRI